MKTIDKKGARLLSVILAIAVLLTTVVTVMSATVHAATNSRNTTLRLDNYGETIYGGTWSVVENGVSAYVVNGSDEEGWTWEYDTVNEKYTLTLDNVDIAVANGTAIQLPNPKTDIKVDILLIGENTVSGGGNGTYDGALCGIYAPVNTQNPYSVDVTILGSGTLNVSSNPNQPITHNYGKAIYIVNGSLTVVEDATINANGTILASYDITIRDSEITVKGFNDNGALYTYNNIIIENSKIDAAVDNQRVGNPDNNTYSIFGDKGVTIKDSSVTATGGAYGIIAGANGDLIIKNSEIIADGHTRYGLGGKNVVIENGAVVTAGKWYGIYASDGVIDVNNSEIFAKGEDRAAIFASQQNNTDQAILLGSGLAIKEDGKIGTTENPDNFGNTKTSFINKSNDYVYALDYSYNLKEITIYITADYSAVDAAIAKIPADLSLYTVDSVNALNAALNTVVRSKDITEQAIVDGYALAIEGAITALVYKDADYSAVDAAIAKIPADLSLYAADSVNALNAAVNAVVRNKDITEQAMVDGYAQAIEDAIIALVVNNTTLGDTIKDAEEILKDADIGDQPGKYPQVEADKLQDAIDKAKGILDDSAATKEDINKAIQDLLDAIKIFENSKIPLTGPTEPEPTDPKPNPTDPSDSDNPNTGDNSNMLLWLLLGGTSLTVLGLTIKRRKRYSVK